MSSTGLKLYSLLRRMLPSRVQEIIGASSLMGPLRDSLFGAEGNPRLADGEITWEGWTFSYTAPYKAFLKAKETGIENRICRLARATLRPGDAAIDVGANYGFVSTVMAKSIMPDGHLLAFEIDPGIAQIVRLSMKRNGLDTVAKIIGQGAGAALAGDLVTVDHVVQQESLRNVRFFKVDTDGADYLVLVGAAQLLRDTHPIVVVEMSDRQQDIFDFLCKCDYRYFLGQDGKSIVPGNWPENLIASTDPVNIPERGAFFGQGETL